MNMSTSVSSRPGAGPAAGISRRREALAPPASLFAAQPVGHPPRCHVDQPAHGVVRRSLCRPLLGGRDQRLLHGVLGVGEVAEPPHDDPEGLRRRFTQQALDAHWSGHVEDASPGLASRGA